MADYRGTIHIVLDVENCRNEAEAKEAVMLELSDYLRHNDWRELITVQRLSKVATATIQICYKGGDYSFRCPKCESLNINGETTLTTCPDCGAEFTVPDVELCDC